MKTFVLMTAMPPTTGHLQLIQFASNIAPPDILLCTQPSEPYVSERSMALYDATLKYRAGVGRFYHYEDPIEQDPSTPGFFSMWRDILKGYGVDSDTIIVTSELYGKKLAEITGARFMPYDLDRQLNSTKAEQVRNDPFLYFGEIIPEFQKYLRTRVTIFGAESTGKTTLARSLATSQRVPWLFEYARPYLEINGPEITVESMTDIWRGQNALQQQAESLGSYPLIIQDTDLYSTIGYWEQPHWKRVLGDCPYELILRAKAWQSDLYLVTLSDIPFEQDPIRYGGNHRESLDSYWINLCIKYELPYVILNDRSNAESLILQTMENKQRHLIYDRHGF